MQNITTTSKYPNSKSLIKYIKTFTDNLYVFLIRPKSIQEETYHKELVCNILIIFIIVLTVILNILTWISLATLRPGTYTGINPFIMLSIAGSFICLLYVSRKGHVEVASELLIIGLMAGGFYAQITWGADLPSTILLWCFTITASSILISTKYSFLISLIIGLGTILLQSLEQAHIISPIKTWKGLPFRLDDAFEYSVIFALIAGVSWISNREIFKSLSKVKASKIELQNERDSLEIKVGERTQELHQAQIDKINSMYQLVEFGRLSSGLFHDLVTPLNTLGLSIQNLNKDKDAYKIEQEELSLLEKQLNTCIRTSSRIINLVSLAKRQLQQDDTVLIFDINQEIENSISLLQSKLKQNRIELKYNFRKKIQLNGNPILFGHIVTNLISNAIDSYQDKKNDERKIFIHCNKKNTSVVLKIKDFGCGIPKEIQSKIFDPFFTTKSKQGCGIGLSATKHTLEKYFNGKISFISNAERSQGTTFIIKIPVNKFRKTINENNTDSS